MPGSFKISLTGSSRISISPEVRLGLCFAASIVSLAASDLYALMLLFFSSLFYLFLQVRLKAIIMAYIIFFLMMIIAISSVWILSFLFPVLKQSPLQSVSFPFIRMGVAVNTIMPLALYASMSGLILTMKRLPLPGIIKLPMLITIRFIPSFLNDLQQIRQAIGLRFRNKNKLFWFLRPALWWRVFFLPLVVRLIRSADELAVAAELKGLSAETDFGAARLILQKADKYVLVFCNLIVVAASLLQVMNASG